MNQEDFSLPEHQPGLDSAPETPMPRKIMRRVGQWLIDRSSTVAEEGDNLELTIDQYTTIKDKVISIAHFHPDTKRTAEANGEGKITKLSLKSFFDQERKTDKLLQISIRLGDPLPDEVQKSLGLITLHDQTYGRRIFNIALDRPQIQRLQLGPDFDPASPYRIINRAEARELDKWLTYAAGRLDIQL